MAQAIYARKPYWKWPDQPHLWDELQPSSRESFCDAARAAIEAMREPLGQIIADRAQQFLDPAYAAPQPVGSITERFACRECARAIDAAFDLALTNTSERENG